MGGFTALYLKNVTQENIDLQNQNLREFGLSKRYYFYSEKDVEKEYQYYLKKDGNYPEHLFPSNKINSYKDFKKFWSSDALGECFVPKFGSLICDVYFGRMSKRAMRALCKYLAYNHSNIKRVSGSYTTLLERGATKKETKVLQYLDSI